MKKIEKLLDKFNILIESGFLALIKVIKGATPTKIIKFIKQKGTAHRSLFLLDQYGWSDVSFKTIRKIFSELANPEILLTFAVDALINFFNTDQIG